MSASLPIRLYVGANYKEPKLYTHVELLFPFWGVTAKDTMPYVKAANDSYQYSKEDFTLVGNIQDADFVLVPYSFERLKATNPARLTMIIEEAKKAHKPLLIDGSGDLEYPILIPHCVVMRISQYAYSRKSNEITVPFPTEDLLLRYGGGELQVRKKKQIPSVGFVGWATQSARAKIKTAVKELGTTVRAFGDTKRGAEHKGIFFRSRALSALARSKRVEAHLVARGTYSGHVKTIGGEVKDVRQTFVNNLLNADYALSVRGDANASVRFYEALSLGRIPLFLDTACVLPLEDRINYRDFCVFVDWKDTDRIADRLADFHNALSPEKFEEMQRKARETYVNYLRIDAFSRHLADQLRAHLQENIQ